LNIALSVISRSVTLHEVGTHVLTAKGRRWTSASTSSSGSATDSSGSSTRTLEHEHVGTETRWLDLHTISPS
jgi:hypothetical protein